MSESPDAGERPDLGPERALEALRWAWHLYYAIWVDPDSGKWLARRIDGQGVIEGDDPDRVLAEMREDWLLRPAMVRR